MVPQDQTDRLNSWKAIASYLERDVRTVQLWEKEQALPVYRQRHSQLSSVFAYKSELDQWRLDRTERPKRGTAQSVGTNGDAAVLSIASPANVAVFPNPALNEPAQKRRRNLRAFLLSISALTVAIVVAGWVIRAHHQGAVPTLSLRTIPLTSQPGVETMPAFSPDGRHIAYVRAERETRNPDIWRAMRGPSSIYLKLVDAGTELRLTQTNGADSFPAWSPDSQYIAFCRRTLGVSGYYVVSALGGPERRIPGDDSHDVCAGLDWLPGGKGLVVSEMSERSQASPLTSISLETGERRILTVPPADSMGDIYPKFSPDRKWLAFIRVRAYGNADIWIAPAAGGKGHRLTTDHVWKEHVAWLPDSRGLVFPALQSSAGRLWRISLNGGALEAITPDGEGVAMPTLALEGHRLAYVHAITSVNLWALDLAAAKRSADSVPRELIVSTRSQFDPQYSPDGRKVAFLSDRSGSEEIWISDADGETAARLTHIAGPPTGSPAWSRDGSEIAFDTRLYGNPDIWIIQAGGGAPQRVTTSGAEDVVPSWSRDGKWIYFASNRSGAFQIWKVARTGESRSNPAVQVTRDGGFCGMETSDGSYLYFSKGRGTAGLWRRAIGTDGAREEPVLPSLQHWGWWTLAPQGILYFEPNGGTVQLMLSDLSGSASHSVARIRAPIITSTRAITASPDGAHVVYAQIDQGGADIMALEGFH